MCTALLRIPNLHYYKPPHAVSVPVSVRGQTVVVSNVTVVYQQQAVLDCSLTDYSGDSPVSISIERVEGSLPSPSV